MLERFTFNEVGNFAVFVDDHFAVFVVPGIALKYE